MSKDLDAKIQQNKEMEGLLARGREERNDLIREAKSLHITIMTLKDGIKVLEKRYTECNNKKFQLEEEIAKEKEKYKFLNDVYRETANQFRNTKRELEDTKYLNTMVSERIKNQMFRISQLVENEDKLLKQIVSLKVDVKSAKSTLIEQRMCNMKLSEELRQKEREKLSILKDVSEKELEMKALKRDLGCILSEKEVLQSQLEGKIKETKEKDQTIQLLQQDLIKLEQIIQNRKSEIKLLKIEVENLRRTEAILKNRKNDTENLRIEINDIHRQLLKEKLKNKAMEEEFLKPQNIHR